MNKGFKTSIYVAAAITVIAAGIFLQLYRQENQVEVSQEAVQAAAPEAKDTAIAEDIEQPETPAVQFNNAGIQKVLDEWTYPSSAAASVTITDAHGNKIANLNGNGSYFAASIYKIYVAYEGYLQIDRGEVDPSEVYINGHTRGECLDLMIRESDSPCAEKLWIEIGKQNITDALVGYNINDTSMTGLSTTADDAAKMLQLIYAKENLSEDSRDSYLQSMKTQVYRSTLNKGFSSDVTVYNKIGFNELNEYHDTAVLELEDGRVVIVSVLTNGVGTSKIVQLAKDLELAFLAQ